MLRVNLQGMCLISKVSSCTLLPFLQSFPSKGVPIWVFCLFCNNVKLYQVPSSLHESERADWISEFWCCIVTVGLIMSWLYIQIAWNWGYICYFMLYFFAAVSNLYLMEIKCNVVVGAANMIKIYWSHKVLFRRLSPTAGIRLKYLFQECGYKL